MNLKGFQKSLKVHWMRKVIDGTVSLKKGSSEGKMVLGPSGRTLLELACLRAYSEEIQTP